MIDKETLGQKLSEIRRQIHQYPELGFNEEKTGDLIEKVLKEHGIEVQRGVNKTGVVALVKGNKPGRTIAFRADMDALPISEQNEIPYKSKNEGVMHACGHDGNTTMLLGTAILLAEKQSEISGNAKFLFQPSEEAPPGGAKGMIAEGVLDNPKVDAVVGVHVDPETPVGKVATRIGPHTANADRIRITITGKGGHAAYPHKCIDPIYISSLVVQAIHGLSSRVVDPVEPFVVTLGKISGGNTFNVIPNQVEILGTIRTVSTDTQDMILEKIKGIVEAIPKSYGATGEMSFTKGYPVACNEEGLTNQVFKVTRNYLGEDNVIDVPGPSMGGEDFAYFAQKVPACVLLVGVRNEEKGFIYPWHHPQFNMDEDGLMVGAECLSQIALDFLKE